MHSAKPTILLVLALVSLHGEKTYNHLILTRVNHIYHTVTYIHSAASRTPITHLDQDLPQPFDLRENIISWKLKPAARTRVPLP